MNFFLTCLTLVCIVSGCTDTNMEGHLSLEEKGDIAFARREFLNASNIWKKAYSKNQRNVSLLNKLGESYLKLGRAERAKLFFEKAADIDPDNVDVQIKLAQMYVLTWNLPAAAKICELFRQKNIRQPELDLIRADISLMNNRPDEAENFYRKAVIGSKDSLRTLLKLAIFLKSVDRHEESLEILTIVKKNPIAAAQIYLLMSDYYLLSRQYDQAEQSIFDAIRLEPEDNSLKYHLVQFYLARGKNTKAEAIIQEILKNQDDIYLQMMLADIYILNNKMAPAEKIILTLKDRIKEDTTEFELLQGKFWLYSGRAAYATSHLKSALEIQPGLVNTRYLLGLTHLINGNIKLSENSLTRTLQIHPNHYKALLLISELLYKKKEYGLSLTYLERLLSVYPEDFTGHIIKGLNLLGQEKYFLAKKEFHNAIPFSQKKYVSYYYLGLTEELMGNEIKALTYYQQVLGIYPDLIDAAYRYCMLLLKMDQPAKANEFVNKRLSATKNSPEVYYLAAKLALNSGQVSRAAAFLKKAVQIDPVPGYIYMELAGLYQKNSQLAQCIETLEHCTQKKPYFPDAWLALCKLYVGRKDLAKAIDIMEQGYAKFKDSPIFQGNLAWLLLETNQEITKALCLAQSAYQKMPDNIALADTLGWAYYHKGIYSQAIWLLTEAEKKAPENGFIRYHLGMTYYQQGEIDKAIQQLKIAQKSAAATSFADALDIVFSDLSAMKKGESKTHEPGDPASILSPPENETAEENMIAPEWNQ